MAETKVPTLSPAAKRLYQNQQAAFEKQIVVRMATLSPEMYTNFNAIVEKYPTISKDLVMSMVQNGLTANTPGLDKIVSYDGIATLKQDLVNVDNIKRTVKDDRSIVRTLGDALDNTVYDPLKGVSRFLFSALRAPYDYGTTITRDVRQLAKDRNPAAVGQLFKDFAPGLGGQTTQFGALTKQLISGKTVDTGDGFFISPESEVGKAQARAMASYGTVNNQSFTIGRGLLTALGSDPNSTAYRIMSGLVDASLNIAADPSTWIPAGAVSKITRGAKLIREPGKVLPTKVTIGKAKEIGAEFTDQSVAEYKKLFNEDATAAARIANDEASKIRKRTSNKLLKSQQELDTLLQARVNAAAMSAENALEVQRTALGNSRKDKVAKEVLNSSEIAKAVASNPKVYSGELVDGLNRLSADFKNTNGFFSHGIFMDELPQAGKISFGANDLDEFAVTLAGKKTPKLLDLADDFAGRKPRELASEVAKREQLIEDISVYASDEFLSPRTQEAFLGLYNELIGAMREFDGPIGTLVFGDGTYNLSKLLAKASEYKEPELVELLTQSIMKIWNVDGFSNIRSIFGEDGGIVITNSKLIAAVKAKISDSIAIIEDPANIAPNIAKLVENIDDIDKAILDASKKADKAKSEKKILDRRIKDIRIFRDYADKDPEILKEIVNDPQYKKLRKLIDLETTVGEKNLLAEFYNAEVGLTKGFGDELSDDATLALKYMLGNRFAKIAEVVAKETDEARIRNFFGRKLNQEMVGNLADATTADQVYSVFLKYLGQEGTDPNIFRSLSLRKQANQLVANPVAQIVSPVNLVPLRLAENIERSFGRYFVRSIALNLGDLTQLTNGVENWLSSAQIKNVLGKDGQEQVINDVIRKLTRSTSQQERAAIIERAVSEIQLKLARKVGLDDEKVLNEIKNVVRISGKEKALITRYSVSRIATGEVPTIVKNGKDVIKLDGGMSEFQLLQDVIRLPDTKQIVKLLNKYQVNTIYGKGRAARVAAEEVGDIWRTAQLVFRISYILRNVGEMQLRQLFSGHDTILNHPARFLAMMMADPNGGKIGKIASRYARFQYDAFGNQFKNADAEAEHLEAVRAYQTFMQRQQSVSDYTRVGRQAEVAKYYDVAEVGADNYWMGLAYTLNRFASDRLNPDIAKLIISGDEKSKLAFVQKLVDEFDQPDNVIRDFVYGAFRENEGIKRMFLLDNSVQNPTKDDLDADGIFTYLFDESQENSLAGQINIIAGNGPKSHLIKDLIANGEVTWKDKNNNVKRIVIPWKDGPKSADQLAELEQKLKVSLSKNFSSDDLAGSRVLVEKEKVLGAQDEKMLIKWVSDFFEFSAKIENTVNFGPEFQMAYWDYIGRYVDMLDNSDLAQLRSNALKSLAKVRIGGKPIGTKHPTLRKIDKEIKKRSTAEYVHVGGTDLATIHAMSAREGAKYVQNLFYDAAKQRQWAQAWRLGFPFIQAHGNTLYQWNRLFWQNPVPVYKFGKAYNALSQRDTNVLYDVSGLTYDENQGFFYKDEFEELRFKYPIAGTVLGALAGQLAGTGTVPMQVTAPVQSLNLAFGQVNPGMPGLGPALQALYQVSGKSQAFGPVYEIMRDIITPFGGPESLEDIVFPSWLRKTFLYSLGDNVSIQRGVKGWASYLASTGKYGDNPLADDDQRTQLFQDAEKLSGWVGAMNAVFQSIAPATPSQEVLAAIKDNNNKVNFMTLSMLYSHWDEIYKRNPGNYDKAVFQFAEAYGPENLLITFGGSSSAVRGTEDAWSFLNNNPEAAAKYARGVGDVVPYFFPGGEYSVEYYNWQKEVARREPLSSEELSGKAESLIYKMLQSRIVEEQIENLYPQFWYNEQIEKLNKKFGGSRPPEEVVSGSDKERIARVAQALKDPVFRQSPIYRETATFYEKFAEYQDLINELKGATAAQLSGKGGLATRLREELIMMADKLMTDNPAFARMYYGVFSSSLKVEE